MPSLHTIFDRSLNQAKMPVLNTTFFNQRIGGRIIFQPKETERERELDTSHTSELLGNPGYKWAIPRRVIKASGRHH